MSNRPRAEARREEILTAAQKVFADRGFNETNLGEVADHLGFRRQAIYYYFKSKDEILWELMERAGRSLDRAAAHAFDSDLRPRDKLTEVVGNHVRHVLGNADIFRVQFEEVAKLAGDRGRQLRRERAAYVSRVVELITAGQETKDFVSGPAAAQALTILGMCNATVDWYQPRLGITIEQVADLVANVALNGIATPTGIKKR